MAIPGEMIAGEAIVSCARCVAGYIAGCRGEGDRSAATAKPFMDITRIGLDMGGLSCWPRGGLRGMGLPVICIDPGTCGA